MISKLVCAVFGHRVLIDYRMAVRVEPDVIVGPLVRRCVRCRQTLPGWVPQVGDMSRPEDEPRLLNEHERDLLLTLESMPADAYGSWTP